MSKKKRKLWQNKKAVLSGVLSAAMILQPLSTVTVSAASAGNTGARSADQTLKLKPSEASTFNDTNNDGLGEFQGWGTSLCWWANRVGGSSALTEASAKAFFSADGLNMNIGRYNVGGGDLTGEVTEVSPNEKADFYDLSNAGSGETNNPTYSGSKMGAANYGDLANATYLYSDADFGLTKGYKVGSFQEMGWINQVGQTAGDGSNLVYTLSDKAAGTYTVKLLIEYTTGSNDKRDAAVQVNGDKIYTVDADTVYNNTIAVSGNSRLFVATISGVELQEGTNTIAIGGATGWLGNFVKMAVIKSGDEAKAPEGEEFLHASHIVRSDSEVPGYATDVTKIAVTEEKPESWWTENYARADFDCGYAWNYDWDADKNQINVLKAAIDAQGNDFIAEAFSNSPPYFMTESGCSSGNTNSSKDNLRADSVNAFAAYMADVIEHWNNNGIKFQSTDPMNEPATSYWGANSNKQEGCHFDQGDSQSRILIALNQELEKKGLGDIIISGTDETSIDDQISSYNKLSDEAKGVITRIDTHTYGGSNRAGLKSTAQEAGKNLWMSEVDGAYTGGTNAGQMSAAIGLAQRMMTDVNDMECSAWILWNAIDMHVDSSEDGQAWVSKGSNNDYTSVDAMEAAWKSTTSNGYWGLAAADHDNGELILSKKYYAYGQFSRYIRPGYTIIGSSDEDNALVAYDTTGKQAVIVAVNTSSSDKTWDLDLSEFTSIGDEVEAIRTSGDLYSGENWADVSDEKDAISVDTENKQVSVTLKANSITTYTVKDVEYDSSVEVINKVEDVTAYTVDGLDASLPNTVQVTTNKNNKMKKAVTWDLTNVDLTKDGQKVTGTVADCDITATATVKVVTPNMQYFIDCNSLSSPKYAAMDAYADLLNEVPDQKYGDGNSWGYADSYGQYNGDASDEYDTGWYAKSGQSISYTIPMKAGTYQLILGFKEWWRDGNKSRQMTVTATHDGKTETLGTSNTWENSNWWNRDFYDLTCENDGEVTITLTKVSGQPDPTLSFIQVQNVLNLDALKEAIKTAEATDTKNCPSGRVKAMKDAVAAGRTLMLKASTTQEDVDQAVEKINAAVKALNTKPTEAELAANDYVLYLANCGTSDVTSVPSGSNLGLYQSTLDQAYAEDDKAGYAWGYVEDATYSATAAGGTTTLLGSYRYQSDKITYKAGQSGIAYNFDLPEGTYKVTVGIDNPWSQWGTKTEDILLEGEKVESGLTAKDFEGTYEVTVIDGQLNVFVQATSRSSTSDDPVLNYIIVKAIPGEDVDQLEVLKALVNKYKAAVEGKTYTPVSMSAFNEAIEAAEALINDGSQDTDAIEAAKAAIETAYNNLVEAHIETYDSITGTNAARIYDNNGVAVQAHGGQIQKIGDTYYWIGEDRTNGYRPMPGVHMYSSKDLYNWTDEGVVLRTMDSYDQFETDDYFKNLYGDLSADEKKDIYVDLWAEGCVMERPKMLYNEKTGKYVIWFHADGTSPYSDGSGSNYAKAKAGIAIADNINGPYKLVGSYMLASDYGSHGFDSVGGHVRDMNLFQDDDGTAYVMYSSEGNAVMYIAKLNDTYTGLAKDADEMVLGEDFCISSTDSREAPAMFKYQGKYYLITSGCTGWAPNQARYAVADSPLGPWTNMGNPCVGDTSNNTFETQSTCVIPVDAENGKFIYMGDRWYNPDNGKDLSDSRYVWLPIEFGANNTIAIKNYKDWTLDELDDKGAISINTALPETAENMTALKAALPETIDVTIGTKVVKDAKVTWTVDESAGETALGYVTVTGTLEDLNREFTIQVFCCPKSLVYFADCYTNGDNTSSIYEKFAAAATDLKNMVSDQAYGDDNGVTWGYTSTLGASGGSSSQDMGSKGSGDFFDTGWWATSGGKIEYGFELTPGTYTVATGFHEWWSSSRGIKITVSSVDADGKKTELGTGSASLSSSKTEDRSSVDVTVPEGSDHILVTISKASGSDPVLSWIGIISNDAQSGELDWTDFNATITKADQLNEADWTADSWSAFQAVVKEAKDFKANATKDTKQREIREMIAKVNAAKGELISIKEPTGDVTYYVDAVNGNDENDGTTPETAWKTLTKASSIRQLKAGGSILLKAGCVWNGEQLFVDNAIGSTDAPIVIGSYGEGAKPVINGNGANWSASTKEDLAAVHIRNSQNIVIENLEITNWDLSAGELGSYTQSSKLLSGLVVENRDGGVLANVTVRNNKIHDVNGLMAGGADKGAGGLIVLVTGSGSNHTGTVESYYNGLTIEGNEVYNVCHEAIYMESVWASRTIVGGTSSDTGYQNAGNSKWIGSSDVTISDNYVHDVAGDGIVPINTTDAMVENNLIDNSADTNWNYRNNPNHAALWSWDSNNVTFRYNEASNTSKAGWNLGISGTNDSMAFDFDYGVQNCLYEYNYSHDNYGGFLMLCPGPGATVNNIARYNVSVNDGKYQGAPMIRLGTGKYGSLGVQIYNNTMYWENNGGYAMALTPDSAWEGTNIKEVSVFNNIFYGPATANSMSTKEGVTYSNNLVYSNDGSAQSVYEALANDENAVYADPQFADVTDYTAGSWADGQTTLGTANGFCITKTSPAVDAGMAIPEAPAYTDTTIGSELVANEAEIPSVDYYGNALTDGTPDIGANETVKAEDAQKVIESNAEAAKAEIDALENLSQEQKDEFKAQIDAAVANAADSLDDAQTSVDVKAIQAAVQNAMNVIKAAAAKADEDAKPQPEPTPVEKKQGLATDETGTWYYYVDGEVAESYNGLAANEYGWFKVTNGKVDFNYNGLAANEYGWWKITGGAVDFNFNGLAANEYGWWKITGGAVDFNFNGLAANEYGWWKITGGAVDFNFNGLAANEYGWWKITGGAVDFNYNGLVPNEYGWWYVKGGAIDFNYTGLALNENGCWYVRGGCIDFNFNGYIRYYNASYRVAGGYVIGR